jgi:hypothetical protein
MRDYVLEIETERVFSGEEKDPSKLTALSRGEWKEEWRVDYVPNSIINENGNPQVRIET